MTKLDILKKVKEEIDSLQYVKTYEEREFNAIENLIQSNNGFALSNFENTSLGDLFALDYYVNTKEKNETIKLDYVYEKVFNFEALTEDGEDRLSDICDLLEIREYEEGLETLEILRKKIAKLASLKEKNFLFTLQNELSKKDINVEAKLLYEISNNNAKGLDSIIELYILNPDAFIMATRKIIAFQEIRRVNRILEEDIDNFDIKVKKKEKKKIIKDAENESIDKKMLEKDLRTITKYRNNLKKEIDTKEKHRRRKVNNLSKFIELFDKETQKNEITNYEELIKLIKDDELRLEILKFIYNHNKEEYENIDKELKLYSEDEKIKYQTLLSENNINKGSYDIDLVMNNSFEDLNDILKILKEKNITEKELIIYVIENSNLNIIKNIKEFNNNNYLRIIDIKNNIEITNINNNIINELTKLINKIKEFNINPSIFVNENNNILLEDNNILINNLKILEEYNLIKNIRNSNNYNFILSDNLNILLDEIIELDLYKFIEKDMNVLNSNNIRLIKVYKRLGYDINNIDDLYEILNSNFIDKENIDKYLYEYKNDYNGILNNNGSSYNYDISNNNLNYEEINGIKISKKRIERNCNELKFDDVSDEEKEFIVLTYGLSLDEDEYKKIKNEIMGSKTR